MIAYFQSLGRHIVWHIWRILVDGIQHVIHSVHTMSLFDQSLIFSLWVNFVVNVGPRLLRS